MKLYKSEYIEPGTIVKIRPDYTNELHRREDFIFGSNPSMQKMAGHSFVVKECKSMEGIYYVKGVPVGNFNFYWDTRALCVQGPIINEYCED